MRKTFTVSVDIYANSQEEANDIVQQALELYEEEKDLT